MVLRLFKTFGKNLSARFEIYSIDFRILCLTYNHNTKTIKLFNWNLNLIKKWELEKGKK